MNLITSFRRPTFLGLLLLASAGSALTAAEPSPAGSSLSVSADYYNYKTGDDDAIGLVGGTIEYAHQETSGRGFRFGLTALSGTLDPSPLLGAGTTTQSKLTEIRVSALDAPASATWIAWGLEYINQHQNDTNYKYTKHYVTTTVNGRPTAEWDGTYDTKVQDGRSSTTHNLLLKTVLTGPDWHLYRSTGKALTLTPSLDAEAGYLKEESKGFASYIAAAKAKLAYEFGGQTVFLEGGYRCSGIVESGSKVTQGYLGRIGYAYRW